MSHGAFRIMQISGQVLGVAPYSDLVNENTGTVGGLSICMTFDEPPPEPWIGTIAHSAWLAGHPQIAFFASPEGKKVTFPKRAIFTGTINKKGQLKITDFKFQQ